MSQTTPLPTADEPRPERCETCRFWTGTHDDDEDNECRRHAPQPLLSGAETDSEAANNWGAYAAFWPETSAHDWCGEWQGKERPKAKVKQLSDVPDEELKIAAADAIKAFGVESSTAKILLQEMSRRGHKVATAFLAAT